MLPTFHFNIERWKYNPTFELYVSTKGRIRNKSKADVAPKVKPNGYMVVYVYGSLNKYMLLHRVVMLTWRPTPEAEELTVDHKNHNKRDNSLENLEWVTYEENCRRAKEDFISTESPRKVKPTVVGIHIVNESKGIDFTSPSFQDFVEKYGPFREKDAMLPKPTTLKDVVDGILSGSNTCGVRAKNGFVFTALLSDGTERKRN